jgi:hypothetical protein
MVRVSFSAYRRVPRNPAYACTIKGLRLRTITTLLVLCHAPYGPGNWTANMRFSKLRVIRIINIPHTSRSSPPVLNLFLAIPLNLKE